MARVAIAVFASVALGAMDLFVMSVAFLYRPGLGGWVIGTVLIGFALALVLRAKWLVLLVQNLVTAVLLYRATEYSLLELDQRRDANVTSLVVLIGIITLGNLLAWLVARALPAKRRSDGTNPDYSAAGR